MFYCSKKRLTLVSISQTALRYLVLPTQSNCIYMKSALTILIRVRVPLAVIKKTTSFFPSDFESVFA